MAWFSDSLRTAIAAVNPFAARGQVQGIVPGVMNHQMALAAFRSSGMLRKVITVPAEDRVREWRDWQAEKPQIELIEAEEKRLGLVAKVRQAEVLRGIGGGALILAAPGLPTEALRPEAIRKGGLQAVNVVSRWQITGRDYVREITDPAYGTPRMFEMSDDNGQTRIHPSRVICFRGDALPAGAGLGEEDAFWGDSRLMRVLREVENSDATQRWFAELVKKAKLLRISIPKIAEMLGAPGGQARLDSRIRLIAEGENLLNATVMDGGDGSEGGGEKITDFQVTWAGIPAMMDAFDQRVAAVADIPFTRLMGRSPAGMNATGEFDNNQWNKAVGMGQQLETRPCLEQLDPILIRSAGVAETTKIWWMWAPLDKPTEAEEAKTFDLIMTAIVKLIDSGMVPATALAEAVQNLIEERGYLPGLSGALAKLPPEIRFGLSPDDDGSDPSALTQSGNGEKGGDQLSPTTRGAGGSNGAPARAVNDAKAIPLYVQRKLLNADELVRWAKGQGFKTTLEPSDMHVTILYSRTPVDPIKMGTTWSDDQKGNLTVKPGGPRAVEKLGDTAVVLLFASDDLSWRHRSMVEAGASHDYDEYQPHVTISYEVPEGLDIEAIKPFTGALRFGPELFEPLDLGWKSKVTESE